MSVPEQQILDFSKTLGIRFFFVDITNQTDKMVGVWNSFLTASGVAAIERLKLNDQSGLPAMDLFVTNISRAILANHSAPVRKKK